MVTFEERFSCSDMGTNYFKFRTPIIGYRKQDYNYKNEPVFPPKFENNTFSSRFTYHLFHLSTLKNFQRLHDRTPEDVGMEIKM